jgi:uncharacterized protein (DUF2147 family)
MKNLSKNLRKNKGILFGMTLFLLLFAIGTIKAQNADRLVGNWLSEPKDAKINIYKTEKGTYEGKLWWGVRMYEKDGKTSRIAKNGKAFKDMIILKDFVFEDGVWTNGTIYDPEEDKTYKCTMKLKDNKLEIRGYVGISLFGRTVIWEKIN